MPLIEIEQRYKITDPESTVAVLAKHGVTLQDEKHVIDQWFAPTYVHSHEQQERWFDQEHGIAYRIRSILTSGNDTATKVILDSKQLTQANNHNTFEERVILENDTSAMRQFLKDKDYYNWLTLDKTRRMFRAPRSDLLIVMDTLVGVKDALGLDTVLELEYNGKLSRDEALALLGDFAKTLGLTPDLLFSKSMTVEAMPVLARFK